MSDSSTPGEELSNADATSTDERPRKYLRRNNDISIGVTTRSRQREQENKAKEVDSMPSDQSTSTTLNNSATTEQCAICMENLTNQEVGIPENCEHPFCLTCIITWAQKNNSCPIDRIAFRHILKKHSFHCSKPYDSVEVEDNRLEVQLEDDFLEMIDDDISCRVCGGVDQEDLLLICDECGNGYHTFCLELPAVPETAEWMCPLCEADQLSAAEDLYEDSDLEELQHILFDDTFNSTETDNELDDAIVTTAQPRVRQTARMRTGGVRNQRTRNTSTRRTRRQQRPTRQRRAPRTRRLTLMEQQRQRQRSQRRALHNVNRRIETVNATAREGTTTTANTTTHNSVTRNDIPRLSIFDGEPIALEDEPVPRATLSSSRSVITPNEAARRIAASGIPILSRTQTEPSISRQLSVRRIIPSLEPVPSRTIRPPRLPPAPPRIPIRQLPRIQRRVDAPPRPRPVQQQQQPAPPQQHLNRTSSTTSSFLDNLLNTQQRLHNLQNVRIQGPHIQIS